MANKTELTNLLRTYAQRYGIDEGIAVAQINQESHFNPQARSGEANGIAQFTPATARRFGVNVWDVNSSFDGWGRYMRWLLDRYNGNYSFALAGYNAGEGNVDKYGGIPPFSETQAYVRRILGSAGNPPPSADESGYDNFFGIPVDYSAATPDESSSGQIFYLNDYLPGASNPFDSQSGGISGTVLMIGGVVLAVLLLDALVNG